jgi:excinuclease ABC subunit B
VSRAVEESLSSHTEFTKQANAVLNEAATNFDVVETIRELEEEMLAAANNLEFEKAALLRDQVRELKRTLGGESSSEKAGPTSSFTSYKKTGFNRRKSAAK